MSPCPASPNCVSSEATDKRHRIEPLRLRRASAEAWPEMRAAVLSLPRIRLVEERENYLHAECRSAVFGFVDDLELELQAEAGVVAVRSAARTGYHDFGVNRRRVEKLRRLLALSDQRAPL